MQLTYEYLNDLRRQLDDVGSLLATDDHANIRRFAHRAKGTSGTFGLAAIAEVFSRLEQASGCCPREHMAELVLTIRQLVEAQTEKLRPAIPPSGQNQNGDIHG